MICPGEFECAVFADGEMAAAEARAIAMHLESCPKCEALVGALRRESQLLVHSFQEAALDDAAEFVPVWQPAHAARLAISIGGIAAGLRLLFDIAAGFQLPVAIAWLDPRQAIPNVGTAINALLFAIEDGGAFMTDALQMSFLFAVFVIVFAGIARIVRRNPVTSAVVGVVLAILALAPSAHAIEVRRGSNSVIEAGTVIDDTVVMFGDSIAVHGTINGDLIALGRQVTITGMVTGDVITGSRRLDVRGSVGGNIFGMGEDLEISGPISRNLYGIGDTILVEDSGTVGGNATTLSESTIVDGEIGRDVVSMGQSLDARGQIARNIFFRGSRLSLLEKAAVGGTLSARVGDADNVRIDSGVTIGGARDIQVEQGRPSRYSTARFYIWQVIRLCAALVAGLLLFWLFPGLASGASTVSREWLKAGGVGFIAIIVMPIAAIIAAITVVGLPIAAVTLALWIAGLYLSKIIVAQFIGRSIAVEGRFLPLLMGLVLVIAAVNLPFIGGLINILLMILGFGALMLICYRESGWGQREGAPL